VADGLVLVQKNWDFFLMQGFTISWQTIHIPGTILQTDLAKKRCKKEDI
jgi:hypothetical protein